MTLAIFVIGDHHVGKTSVINKVKKKLGISKSQKSLTMGPYDTSIFIYSQTHEESGAPYARYQNRINQGYKVLVIPLRSIYDGGATPNTKVQDEVTYILRKNDVTIQRVYIEGKQYENVSHNKRYMREQKYYDEICDQIVSQIFAFCA